MDAAHLFLYVRSTLFRALKACAAAITRAFSLVSPMYPHAMFRQMFEHLFAILRCSMLRCIRGKEAAYRNLTH